MRRGCILWQVTFCWVLADSADSCCRLPSMPAYTILLLCRSQFAWDLFRRSQNLGSCALPCLQRCLHARVDSRMCCLTSKEQDIHHWCCQGLPAKQSVSGTFRRPCSMHPNNVDGQEISAQAGTVSQQHSLLKVTFHRTVCMRLAPSNQMKYAWPQSGPVPRPGSQRGI